LPEIEAVLASKQAVSAMRPTNMIWRALKAAGLTRKR
jgi:hypothetical protein